MVEIASLDLEKKEIYIIGMVEDLSCISVTWDFLKIISKVWKWQ